MESDGKIFLLRWATEFVNGVNETIADIKSAPEYNTPSGVRSEATAMPVGNKQMQASMKYDTQTKKYTFALLHGERLVYGTSSDGDTFVQDVSENLNTQRCTVCMLISDKIECLICQAAKLQYSEVCPGCNIRPNLNSVILECSHRICRKCIYTFGFYPEDFCRKYTVECPGCKTTITYENQTCDQVYSLREWERDLSDNSDDSDDEPGVDSTG
jgi:hypothetical protein